MNNSVFSPPKEEEKKPDRRERVGRLATLIESVEKILASSEWSTLKQEEFDNEIPRLTRLLVQEAKKKEINQGEIYRLQGRLEEAKRLSLEGLLQNYRVELETITKQLQ